MARSFHEVIAEVDGELLLEVLARKLAEVTAGVIEVEKAGSITLKLSIKPNGDGKVMIDSDVTAKAPNQPISTSVFYASAAGDLTRNNPAQADFNVRPSLIASNG
jgi:hypothetical protein